MMFMNHVAWAVFSAHAMSLKPISLAPGSECYGLPGIDSFNVTLECVQISLDCSDSESNTNF